MAAKKKRKKKATLWRPAGAKRRAAAGKCFCPGCQGKMTLKASKAHYSGWCAACRKAWQALLRRSEG